MHVPQLIIILKRVPPETTAPHTLNQTSHPGTLRVPDFGTKVSDDPILSCSIHFDETFSSEHSLQAI